MIDPISTNSLFDARVIDGDGEKVGTVKQVYVDHDSGRPLFVSVATGFFGTSESLVPLQDASFDGDCVHTPHRKATVKDAPRVDADDALTDEEQDRLWAYYEEARRDDRERTSDEDSDDQNPSLGSGDRRAPHEPVPGGRVRLRRYVVTEQQNITVPVQREEVRVEREPITEENIVDAPSKTDVTEKGHEVTLNEERVVIDEESAPREQVLLERETVAERRTASGVAHEEIRPDEDGEPRHR